MRFTPLFWSYPDVSSISVSSLAQLCPTLCDPMDCSMPGFPVHHQLAEFAQSHIHWVSDAIQPSHPLSSPSPPAFNLSQNQGLFKWVSSSHKVTKVLEFSFNISPSNEHPGLISFGMDWLDLLAVQGTLKSFLQLRSSKASIPCSLLKRDSVWDSHDQRHHTWGGQPLLDLSVSKHLNKLNSQGLFPSFLLPVCLADCDIHFLWGFFSSFLPKELPLIFLVRPVCYQWILSIPAYQVMS